MSSRRSSVVGRRSLVVGKEPGSAKGRLGRDRANTPVPKGAQRRVRYGETEGVPRYEAGGEYERGQKHLNAEVAENSRGGRREGHVAAFACCARAGFGREGRRRRARRRVRGENPHPNVAKDATLGWGTRRALLRSRRWVRAGAKALKRRGRGEQPRRAQRRACSRLRVLRKGRLRA